MGSVTHLTTEYNRHLLAISLGRKQEHALHMMLPHSRQWCCRRAILKLEAQLGQRLTLLPSSQATSACSWCLRSEPSSRSSRSSRMTSLLVSVVRWSSLSRRAALKKSVCERDRPAGCGSDGSIENRCCDISFRNDTSSDSSNFRIFFFAFPTSSVKITKF